ncbi:hypothetical protein VTK26DRAFT_9461 [Humicola hyalothermophila]
MAITRIPLGPGEDDDGLQQQQQPEPGQQPAQLPLPSGPTAAVDIEAWTVAALESLSLASLPRGAVNTLSLPVDTARPSEQRSPRRSAKSPRTAGNGNTPTQMKLRGVAFDDEDEDDARPRITPPRRPPSRRDSLRRREALLKGKEGSRQRRRWENDRLVHVPNVQPPLPSDWQIQPTHRVLPPVPYQLAAYYDDGNARRRRRPTSSSKKSTTTEQQQQQQQHDTVGRVPRDLRATAKRTPAVKSWLRVLEEPVRAFAVERGVLIAAAAATTTTTTTAAAAAAAAGRGDRSGCSETDSDEEEIVFAGRRHHRHHHHRVPPRDGGVDDDKSVDGGESEAVKAGAGWKQAYQIRVEGRGQGKGDGDGVIVGRGLVLDTMDDGDVGGAFKRWLTHSISDYYGLDSKSVTVGNPARRVVYVGVKQKQTQAVGSGGMRHKPPSRPILPPPLWEMF